LTEAILTGLWEAITTCINFGLSLSGIPGRNERAGWRLPEHECQRPGLNAVSAVQAAWMAQSIGICRQGREDPAQRTYGKNRDGVQLNWAPDAASQNSFYHRFRIQRNADSVVGWAKE
jgi:hypothetical protein